MYCLVISADIVNHRDDSSIKQMSMFINCSIDENDRFDNKQCPKSFD